jgi:hypothetical protein
MNLRMLGTTRPKGAKEIECVSCLANDSYRKHRNNGMLGAQNARSSYPILLSNRYYDYATWKSQEATFRVFQLRATQAFHSLL